MVREKVTELKQWEYLAVTYTSTREVRLTKNAEAAFTEWLNAFGKDGWEMVSLTDQGLSVNCVFKREQS